MQVILLERLGNLGQMGQLVNVKEGYARNFLLPKKKALRATKVNIELFEKQKSQLEANNLQKKKDAEYVSEKMQGLSVTIIRQASEIGQLYGAIRNKDIADEVVKAGFSVDKSQVVIKEKIKTTGEHEVEVLLHPEVSVKVNVLIAQSMEEALAKSKTKESADSTSKQ